MCFYFEISVSGFILFPQSQSNVTWVLEETGFWADLRFLTDSKNRASLSIKIRFKLVTLSTVIIALVFWSAKNAHPVYQGHCVGLVSQTWVRGSRLSDVTFHLVWAATIPRGREQANIWCFRALVIKPEYPGKQICFFLTSFSSDLMSLNSLVLLVFLFFARLPLFGLLLALMFPLTSCPCAVEGTRDQCSLCWGPSASLTGQHLRTTCCANPGLPALSVACLDFPKWED